MIKKPRPLLVGTTQGWKGSGGQQPWVGIWVGGRVECCTLPFMDPSNRWPYVKKMAIPGHMFNDQKKRSCNMKILDCTGNLVQGLVSIFWSIFHRWYPTPEERNTFLFAPREVNKTCSLWLTELYDWVPRFMTRKSPSLTPRSQRERGSRNKSHLSIKKQRKLHVYLRASWRLDAFRFI